MNAIMDKQGRNQNDENIGDFAEYDDNGNVNDMTRWQLATTEKPKCDRKYPPEAQTPLHPLGRDKNDCFVLVGRFTLGLVFFGC